MYVAFICIISDYMYKNGPSKNFVNLAELKMETELADGNGSWVNCKFT